MTIHPMQRGTVGVLPFGCLGRQRHERQRANHAALGRRWLLMALILFTLLWQRLGPMLGWSIE